MMIKKTLTGFTFAVSLVWIGCHCCTIQQTGQQTGDSTKSAVHSGPSAITQQVSYVSGIIDSVIVVDTMRYKITLRLTSVASGGSGESMAEPGQRLTLVPQFVSDANGHPDLSHSRTKSLMSLMSAKKGDTIRCSIVYSIGNGWMLIDTNP